MNNKFNIKNRLLKYFKEEEVMEIHSTDDLKKGMEEAEGYCVAVSLLNIDKSDKNKGQIVHYLLLNNFPLLDLLRCNKKAKELMIKELEKDSDLPEF